MSDFNIADFAAPQKKSPKRTASVKVARKEVVVIPEHTRTWTDKFGKKHSEFVPRQEIQKTVYEDQPSEVGNSVAALSRQEPGNKELGMF